MPGNNNWQVPICVQLLKNYHPAWYYPSALGRLVLWKELLMADFSIPQGCAHAEVSAPSPDFKVNELWAVNKKYHSLRYSFCLYFQCFDIYIYLYLYISVSLLLKPSVWKDREFEQGMVLQCFQSRCLRECYTWFCALNSYSFKSD